MVRPRKIRQVKSIPEITYFKPAGVPLRELQEVVLTVEETEAIRLKDKEGKSQEECAKIMNISRPTFQRILNTAREKVADFLVNGKAIKIHGGDYMVTPRTGRGQGRGAGQGAAKGRTAGGRGAGQGRGRMSGGFGLGPGGECVCPSCGHKVAHTRGVPCYQQTCPKCGAKMTRA